MFNPSLIFIGSSIPIFVVLTIATISRRLTKGRSNVLFLVILWLSIFASISDFLCAFAVQNPPLSDLEIWVAYVFNYVYFFTRHAVNMLYIPYMYAVTRTWFKTKRIYVKLLIVLPYSVVCALLFMNMKNHYVFTVTAEEGYSRGDGIIWLYIMAAMYLVYGVYMLVTRRKLLRLSEWMSLSSIYFLNIIGIGIQFVNPMLLVENYFTAITLIFVVLYVQKPEIQVDMNTGLPGYFAFRDELKKIEISGQKVQVIIASVTNAEELRRYLGEKGYFGYIHELEKAIRIHAKKENLSYDFFYEDRGNIYLILGNMEYNPVQAISDIREMVRAYNKVTDSGIMVDIKVVTIKFPEDIQTESDLTRFGHNFSRFSGDKIFYHAPQIFDQREYQIQMRLDEVIRRSIRDDRIRLSFDPVWSVGDDRAVFAVAVASMIDPDFGEIDEKTLEEASGFRGANILFEENVMEQVFSYVGSGVMTKEGFSYVVVKLSASMGMQKEFTDIVWNLRSKYAVHPEQICFAVKESVYNNIGDTYRDNIEKLSLQGYKLALAGYGRGYTNIKFLSKLPISSIILSGSLISEMKNQNDKVILRDTIRMLKDIELSVVAPKVDDEEKYNALLEMGCELMQGKYFEGKKHIESEEG